MTAADRGLRSDHFAELPVFVFRGGVRHGCLGRDTLARHQLLFGVIHSAEGEPCINPLHDARRRTCPLAAYFCVRQVQLVSEQGPLGGQLALELKVAQVRAPGGDDAVQIQLLRHARAAQDQVATGGQPGREEHSANGQASGIELPTHHRVPPLERAGDDRAVEHHIAADGGLLPGSRVLLTDDAPGFSLLHIERALEVRAREVHLALHLGPREGDAEASAVSFAAFNSAPPLGHGVDREKHGVLDRGPLQNQALAQSDAFSLKLAGEVQAQQVHPPGNPRLR